MQTAGVVSHLLQELYSAPLEPERWQTFFGSLCLAAECEMGVFTTCSAAGNEALAGGGINFDTEPLELYNSHYGSIDPFVEPSRRNIRHAVIEDVELISRSDILKTEFYNDLLSPFGLHHVTVVPCFFNTERQDYITLFRGNRHGRLDTESTQLISFLLPHMTNALRTRHVLAAASVRSHLWEAALDRIPAAAFILSAKGQVVQMNRKAEDIAREGKGLTLKAGRLRASKTIEDGQLSQLIQSALPKSFRNQRGNGITPPQSVRISRAGKPPLLVTVMMIPASMPQSVSGAFVLCLVSDPSQHVGSPNASLEILYNLSPTEQRVAELVHDGQELKKIAGRLGITYDAVRFHLKCIFRKTGTQKQSDLVRLMTSLGMQS